MSHLFAHRAITSRKSFIREILKITENSGVISFAGGLPNPKFFPLKEITAATAKVMETEGSRVLQYTTTEGIPELRGWISDRYKQRGLDIKADEILITNGAQQAIAIIGKTFLEKGDHVAMEKPGYVGAYQAFGFYEPVFNEIPLLNDGIDTEELWHKLVTRDIHLMYVIPNFQNPTGIEYSEEKRKLIAALLKEHDILTVEDEAYRDLRFEGEHLPAIRQFYDTNHILLGSFSKIVAPGLRIGWLCAKQPLMDKLIAAKQANDLHTSHLTQKIIARYLTDNDIEWQIGLITSHYRQQCQCMIDTMDRFFPKEVQFASPKGGMFIWAKLPEGILSEDVLQASLQQNVAFVPGNAFCSDRSLGNTMRLNFTNSDETRIEEGIKRLGKILGEFISQNGARPARQKGEPLKLTGTMRG